MGLQANRNPRPAYSRRFSVSHHAVQRLRERHADPKSLIARTDADLANLIDERLRRCKPEDRVELIDNNYNGTPSTICKLDFEDCGFGRLIAVLRQDTCVTLLAEHMLELNIMEKKWVRPQDMAASPFAKLREMTLAPTPAERVADEGARQRRQDREIGELGSELAMAKLALERASRRAADLHAQLKDAEAEQLRLAAKMDEAQKQFDEALARAATTTTKEK